jgi:metal-sulfur cluster biosynthetic enzyme
MAEGTATVTQEEVYEALEEVIDPELGLVYEVDVRAQTSTSPSR